MPIIHRAGFEPGTTGSVRSGVPTLCDEPAHALYFACRVQFHLGDDWLESSLKGRVAIVKA
jgi:hypothetical protein